MPACWASSASCPTQARTSSRRWTLEGCREALQVVRELRLPLLVHAESAEAAASIPEVYTRSYREWLAAHPRGLENLAVAQVIEAARETGGHAHIVHLSSADTLPMLATAAARVCRSPSRRLPTT